MSGGPHIEGAPPVVSIGAKDAPFTITCNTRRNPARGRSGGKPGAPGRVMLERGG
ncbi:MAG TPA: hypothetical protein VFC18_14305 [Burkholderiales bacterium]|nr:hypothetical protein [Burkholderiales bacterium]